MAARNQGPVVVTEENFGELLIEGLREAVAVRRGEREPARKETRAILDDQDGSRPGRPTTGR
jgi:hypothetical protein